MENKFSQQASSSNIKVFCRFRPFNAKELEKGAQPVFRLNHSNHLVIKDTKDISFMFDEVFDMKTTQQCIFRNIGMPVLNNILDGFNGTILAYGQTSSGKTHTMQGADLNDKEMKGLIPRIIQNLFQEIEKSPETIEFKLKVSIFQLYMEKIRDLLDVSKNDLKIRQNKQGPYVQNLTQAYIAEKIQIYKLLHLGLKNRVTCVTNMNQHSSRSHMIFLLTLNQFNSETSQSKTSKLYLIDLAGSEKISKTGVQGKALEQAKKINLSLTSLGKVIKSLSERISFVPYRDSKLTRILCDSLGGNSKTTLIVTCSPHEIHLPETISTLRFGQSAQRIKNKPKINRELTVPQLQKMIQKLQSELQYKDFKLNLLQNYIKNNLNADLPKIPPKLPKKGLEGTQQLNESHQVSNQPIEQEEQHFPKEQLAESIQFNNMASNMSNTNPNYISAYQQQIATLQSQISTYKTNLQSQLAKFYQLKKQYNNINQNLKDLIQQNMMYQEQIKEYEDEKVRFQEDLQNKYRSNCKLLFGQLENMFRIGTICEKCYEQVDRLVVNKGNFLLSPNEKNACLINCYDYWKEEKDQINKKMQEVINKSININTIYDKKYPQATLQSQPATIIQSSLSQESNQKLFDLESKLDKLHRQYQEMLNLQTNWKVECQIYERKLKMKEEKITELKNMLQDISEQMELMTEDYDDTMSVNTRIVKPLKGGFLLK